MNKFLTGGRTRGGVRALERIEASLLPVSDFAPVSLSCSPGILAEKLMQGLRWVVRDPRVIAKDGGLSVIFSNGLADLLGVELLEL